MRVLYITVRADHGGGPRHLDLLINNLSENIEVFLACPNDDPYFYSWDNNVKIKEITIIPHRKFSLLKLLTLSKFIKKFRIDIVHSHGKGAGVYSRLLKLLNPRLKIVHTFHGVHTGMYGKLAKLLYFKYERFAKRLTQKFINVSYGERDICISNGFCNTENQITIYNGIPQLDSLEKQISKEETSTFKVITISRFDYSKHMQLAFEIAKQISTSKQIEFIWVGDGPDKEILEEKAKVEGMQNIVFTGFTNDPNAYLKEANLYLSTSRWEGLPLSLIEACALGLPIIATNVTGNNEVVIHGYNGYLYDQSNVNEASDYIRELHDKKELHSYLSQNAFDTFSQKFTIEEMASKTESVYFNV